MDAPFGARATSRGPFGDGGHPTTLVAGVLLDEALNRMRGARDAPGPRVLDAGSGSGVLAARALAGGAGEVVAVDRDAEAARATRARAAGARVAHRDLANGLGDLGRFDLVAANLPEPELSRLIPSLAAALDPGGDLIATGAHLAFAARVERALSRAGLALRARRARSGWFGLLAARRGDV